MINYNYYYYLQICSLDGSGEVSLEQGNIEMEWLQLQETSKCIQVVDAINNGSATNCPAIVTLQFDNCLVSSDLTVSNDMCLI